MDTTNKKLLDYDEVNTRDVDSIPVEKLQSACNVMNNGYAGNPVNGIVDVLSIDVLCT